MMIDAVKDALQALKENMRRFYEDDTDAVIEILGQLYQKGLNDGRIMSACDNFNNNLGKPLSERHYR